MSIGTHLINDFYEKSNEQFKKSIFDKAVTAELMAINFEMRSKKFIEEVNDQNNSLVSDQAPTDKIFTELFMKVFQLISSSNADSKMEEYTSNFFKIVIRIFQTSKKFLNMDSVKTLVD